MFVGRSGHGLIRTPAVQTLRFNTSRSVEGSCAEAQMCFDSCYQETKKSPGHWNDTCASHSWSCLTRPELISPLRNIQCFHLCMGISCRRCLFFWRNPWWSQIDKRDGLEHDETCWTHQPQNAWWFDKLKAHALSTLRQELILAQQEAIEQKDLREQDLAQLRRACEGVLGRTGWHHQPWKSHG